MEYFLFPKKTYYLTQAFGPDSFSHKIGYAIDVSAAGGGDSAIYAPFSGFVANKYVDERFAYTIWLVSNEKVICADGIARYAVAMLTHPSEIADMYVGQTFEQGEFILNDGRTGNATGEHLDLRIAVYDNKDDISPNFYYENGFLIGLVNNVNPFEYMVMRDDTIVLNDTYLNQVYLFKKVSEVSLNEIYTPGVYQVLADLRVRTGPGLGYRQKRVREMSLDGRKNATSKNLDALAFYKNGTMYDALEIFVNSKRDIWARTYSGYVNIINNEEINSQKRS